MIGNRCVVDLLGFNAFRLIPEKNIKHCILS